MNLIGVQLAHLLILTITIALAIGCILSGLVSLVRQNRFAELAARLRLLVSLIWDVPSEARVPVPVRVRSSMASRAPPIDASRFNDPERMG